MNGYRDPTAVTLWWEPLGNGAHLLTVTSLPAA